MLHTFLLESDIEKLVHGLPFRVPVVVIGVLGVVYVVAKLAPAVALPINLAKVVGRVRQRLLRSDAVQRAVRRRQLFAEHVEGRLRDLNNREDWSDHRFAELEAEVEVVAAARGLKARIASLKGGDVEGPRRERSLSRALARSNERLILVQGDPGSGKSVALRHVALELARQAASSKAPGSVIPVYVNLKRLKRREDEPIDAQLIERFVRRMMSDNVTSDVDAFIHDEFRAGVEAGAWMFLFDSFDEIPEVLAATDVDESIKAYSDAIFAFLHGMNRCRGIVASRAFRAPIGASWPTFVIQPLSLERRHELIGRAGLSREQEQELRDAIGDPHRGLVGMASNPMFLGLLCELMRASGTVPESAHAVFHDFVERRLRRDAERVQDRFGVTVDQVRRAAEHFAFTMFWVDGLGLSPERQRLFEGVVESGFVLGRAQECADALVYMKLAQEDGGADIEGRVLTFAHRRFAEYFATLVVLREPSRVPTRRLLQDGNWRETAVTLLQNRDAQSEPLLAEAGALAEAFRAEVRSQGAESFRWPRGAHHMFELLQAGLGSAARDLPDRLADPAGEVLELALTRGAIYDRKAAIDVAGVVGDTRLTGLLQAAFAAPSEWLRDAAFRQAGRLTSVTDDIVDAVRRTLVGMYANGRLFSKARTVRAELLRLPSPRRFVRAAALLRVGSIADGIAQGSVALIAFGHSFLAGAVLVVVGVVAIRSLRDTAAWLALEPRQSHGLAMVFVIGAPRPMEALFLSTIVRDLSVWEVAGLTYLLLCPPSAVYVAGHANPGHPVTWPLAPGRFLGVALKGFTLRRAGAVLGAAVMLAAVLAAVLGAVVLARTVLPDWLLLGVGGMFALVPAAAMIKMVVAEELSTAVAYAADWRAYGRWSAPAPATLSAVDFCTALERQKTGAGAVRIARSVRHAASLSAGDDDIDVLRSLVTRLENGEVLSSQRTTTRDQSALLDELGRLVEAGLRSRNPRPIPSERRAAVLQD